MGNELVMDVGDFFGQGWAELIAGKMGREDKKSLSQVSRAARLLVYRSVSQLVATCGSSIAPSRFPQLRDLEIQGGLEKIANFLQHLHVSSLVIRSNHLSEHAVGAIAGVTTLQRLDLQYSTVKDLGAISSLRSLTELNLQHVPEISRIEDLSRLSVLTDLVSLHVGYSDVDRTLLHEFNWFFPFLTALDMSYSLLLTHSGARFRFSSFSHLVSLSLDGYSDMRDLTPLEHLGHFKSFAFRDCGLQNHWLVSLSFTTKLEFLALSRNSSLTDEGIRHLTVLQSLQNLECRELANITENGIMNAVEPLPRLNLLDITGSGVNVAGVRPCLSNVLSLRF